MTPNSKEYLIKYVWYVRTVVIVGDRRNGGIGKVGNVGIIMNGSWSRTSRDIDDTHWSHWMRIFPSSEFKDLVSITFPLSTMLPVSKRITEGRTTEIAFEQGRHCRNGT